MPITTLQQAFAEIEKLKARVPFEAIEFFITMRIFLKTHHAVSTSALLSTHKTAISNLGTLSQEN